MTDDFVEELVDEDKGFPGFTAEEWRRIDKALKPYLKPDTDWDIEKFLTFPTDEEALRKKPHTPADIKALRKCLRIPTEIESCLYDLTDGTVSPGTAMYEGTTQQNLKNMENDLKKAAAIYDSSNEALQMHLEDQMPATAESRTDYEGQQEGTWTGELVHERTVAPGFSTSMLTDTANQRPYAFGRLLDVALAAVRQAQVCPINPMIARVQKRRTPKNRRPFKLAARKFLDIWERETGIKPVVSDNSSYADDGIKGNVYEFLIACLVPANLVERKVLRSNIIAAYKEWMKERRRSAET